MTLAYMQVKDRDPALFRNARVAAVSLEKVRFLLISP